MKKSKYCRSSIIPKNTQGTCNIFVMYVPICTDGKLLEGGLSSISRIIHSYGDVTITGEGLQIVTMFGTHGHWAVRVLQRATPTVTSVNNGHLRGPVTFTHIPECLLEELSLSVFYGLVLPRLEF